MPPPELPPWEPGVAEFPFAGLLASAFDPGALAFPASFAGGRLLQAITVKIT
jgi:hypothetical protein